MRILGIDPGPKDSAYVIWDGDKIGMHATLPNETLLAICKARRDVYACDDVVIEWITGYGMRVGQETFDTCRWAGRFQEAAAGAYLLARKAVVLRLCGNTNAGDKFVRQALIDRIGPQGTKCQPGPTYGIAGHEWSALAVAVAWLDQYGEKAR